MCLFYSSFVLDYEQQQDTLKVLRQKREAIISYLQKLDGFDSETVAMYLAQAHQRKDLDVKSLAVVGIGITTMILFYMASYDPISNGFGLPSEQNFITNKNRALKTLTQLVGYHHKAEPAAPIPIVPPHIPPPAILPVRAADVPVAEVPTIQPPNPDVLHVVIRPTEIVVADDPTLPPVIGENITINPPDTAVPLPDTPPALTVETPQDQEQTPADIFMTDDGVAHNAPEPKGVAQRAKSWFGSWF